MCLRTTKSLKYKRWRGVRCHYMADIVPDICSKLHRVVVYYEYVTLCAHNLIVGHKIA